MNCSEALRFAENNTGITPEFFCKHEWMQGVELQVPLYQRLFVWEEEQMIQFLEDLCDASHGRAPYYIGTLTVFRRDRDDQIVWELVDGQQRVTMLTLLGCACSHKLGDKSTWEPFILNGNSSENRLCYFARSKDQKDLTGIWENGFHPPEIQNINFRRFYHVFEKFIGCKMDGGKFDLQSFSKYVYENATALVSFLPETYTMRDLNFYFEKMNSAGKQLEAHEILKVRYFGDYSRRWNEVANGSVGLNPANDAPTELAETTLESILSDDGTSRWGKESFESTAPENSTRLVMTFPMFLLHSLSICFPGVDEEIAEYWKPRQLLATFQKAHELWNDEKEEDSFADAFVEAMEDYRQWMDRWIIHIEDEYACIPFNRPGNDTDRYFYRPIWQFQAMLYVSSGERQKWVLESYCEHAKSNFDSRGEDEILAILKLHDRLRHPLQPNEECPDSFSFHSIDRYWFWKLDYILWEKVYNGEHLAEFNIPQKAAVKDYTFRRNRSIEHLHPQSAKDEWGEVLHSFGNLAMISASFNSQQGDDSVGTKFGRMGDKIAKKELESIKLLLMFLAAEGKDEQWNTEKAKKHGQEMWELLKAYHEPQIRDMEDSESSTSIFIG